MIHVCTEYVHILYCKQYIKHIYYIYMCVMCIYMCVLCIYVYVYTYIYVYICIYVHLGMICML